MNRLEHLLSILGEECAEVAQRTSKAARFGMDEVQPGQALTNEERIWQELNDLVAVAAMIQDMRGKGGMSMEAMRAKTIKVEKYLLYSQQCGTLQP
jgi:NTP pyrophosphatase (non-canonical NTP hydrolase)